MSRDDSRLEEALARILERRGAGDATSIEAIVSEHPDLEAPLRARVRMVRMLDALREPAPSVTPSRSVLDSLGRTGTSIRPITLHEPADEAPAPVVLPHTPSGSWGRYSVQGEIARGGVGVVLKARDPDLGRDVALKTLREEHASRPDVLQRFVEEAQIGGQLQHPGVVPVYELGMGSDGHPFFAMKLVKGKTLAGLFAERSAATEDRPRLLSVFLSVCQAMAYAHERRIVHRDLKPSNVMVGSFGEVQVFDWGMAKVLARGTEAGATPPTAADEEDPTTVVRTVRSASGSAPSVDGFILGTPQYMAPEQARGEVHHLDERADVFSLGAILCEILTGKPPYTGTDREILLAAAQARLATAHERLRACGADPELVALALRCMAPERADRPRDARVLAQQVTAYDALLSERARKAEVAEGEARVQVAQERRARRLTLSLAATIVAVLLLGGGGWTWLDHQRRGRAAAVERTVNEALAEATRLRGQAEGASSTEALGLWREALASARHAEALASSDDADEATRTNAAAARSGIEAAERRAEEVAEQRRRDDAMVERLDEIRLRDGDGWNTQASSRAYAAAFRDCLGEDLEALSTEEAARRIQASGIRTHLREALDYWAGLAARSRAEREAFQRLARQIQAVVLLIDADPWRATLRRSTKDLGALRKLAAEANLEKLGAHDALGLVHWLGQAGDPEQAAQLAREVCHRHPGDLWAWMVCGYWHRRTTPPRNPEAVRYFTAAVAIAPRSGKAHRSLGLALKAAGDAKEAEREMREAMRLDPTSPTPRKDLTGLLLEIGDIEGAVQVARAALSLDPRDSELHTNLGAALLSNGDNAGAIRELKEAIALSSQDARPRTTLGSALLRAGDIEGARLAYAEASRLDPKAPGALVGLSQALLAKGEVESALSKALEAARLDANEALAYNAIGSARLAQGRVAEAIQAYREYVRLASNQALAHYQLGNALSDGGALDEAIEELRKATQLQSKYAEAHWNLGLALRNRGRLKEAAEALRSARELASRRTNFEIPRAQQDRTIELTDRLIASADRLPAFVRGEVTAQNLEDALDFADAAYLTLAYAGAALAWVRALELDPSHGADPTSSRRYNAACAAALAGAGKGTDAATLDDAGRARWRKQALEWLRADLDAWKKVPDTKVIRATLEHWKVDADLAGLRDETELAKRPAEEQEACRTLWRDVEAVLAGTSPPK